MRLRARQGKAANVFRRLEMSEISRKRGLFFLAFFSLISSLFFPGYSDDSISQNNATVTVDHAHSGGGKGSTIAIICLLLVIVAILSFFLFKLWQKKKREEQYARLLKLFEEDDELEVELGLRD